VTFQYPEAQATICEFVADEHVNAVLASELATAGHGVQTSAAPVSSFQYPIAHALI
jgi:hypothetical protein